MLQSQAALLQYLFNAAGQWEGRPLFNELHPAIVGPAMALALALAQGSCFRLFKAGNQPGDVSWRLGVGVHGSGRFEA